MGWCSVVDEAYARVVVPARTAWLPRASAAGSVTGTAADWLRSIADSTTQQLVFLTRTVGEWSTEPAVDALAAGLRLATARRPGTSGPVLALWPDWPLLAAATGLAAGHPLAVVEGPGVQLAGWAAESGALDLTTGTTTRRRWPAAVESAMDTIHLNATDGWTPGVGRQIAVTEIRSLAAQGMLRADLLAGVMIARGHRWQAVAQLLRLANQITTRTDRPPMQPRSR